MTPETCSLEIVDPDEAQGGRVNRQPYIVAVYLVDRYYGGPEEGGWWYDAGKLVRVVAIRRSEDAAWRFIERMQRLLDCTLNRGRRPLSSVLCEGVFEVHAFEGYAPRYFPEQRPHYE